MSDDATPPPSPPGGDRRRVISTAAAVVIALVVGLWAGAAIGRGDSGAADTPAAVEHSAGTVGPSEDRE